MSPRRIDRRLFLRGAGVALSLPLFESKLPGTRANSRVQAKRLVCVANPLGFVAENFFPSESGAFSDLPPLLRPLDELRADFSVFGNLDHGVSGGHQAVHSFLSGIRDNEAANWEARNITVDQRAAELSLGETRFPSIVASVGRNSGELECRTSWTRTGVNIPPVTDATKLFEALFVDQTQEQRNRKRRAFRQHASILDAVREQAKSLESNLAAVDREKLDEYLSSVRSVEQQLQQSDAWIDQPKPSVETKPPTANDVFTRRLPMFYELIRLALQTDSTRVATLSIPGNLPVQDLGLQGNYHAFSHHGKSERLLAPLFKIEQFQMQKLAEFLKALKETQLADGSSLLDGTIVLAGSGMGNASSHSNRDLPILLAGGKFRHGNYHRMSDEAHQRIPLSNLFTTILNRLGDLDTERFNRATGNLSEVLV